MGFIASHSSSAKLFGYEIYGDDCPWIVDFTHHKILLPIDNGLYWLAYRFIKKHKYNVVYTDLKPSYHDIDEVMFRACFALLRRYVEGELGTENWYPDQSDCMYKGYRVHFEGEENKEAIDLWVWYKDELPALEKAIEETWKNMPDRKIEFKEIGNGLHELVNNQTEEDKLNVRSAMELECELHKQKQEKLEHLIRIRSHLWT